MSGGTPHHSNHGNLPTGNHGNINVLGFNILHELNSGPNNQEPIQNGWYSHYDDLFVTYEVK